MHKIYARRSRNFVVSATMHKIFYASFTPENKKNKAKNTIIQEVDEVEKSFMNLLSIMSQHFSGKQKMDEDDVFGSTIAYQLRKIEEPRKTQGKIIFIRKEDFI